MSTMQFNVFRPRWCGNCHQSYAVQVDKHTEQFIMAQTHTRGGVHSMTVVTHCIKCNVPLDQTWYENTYTSKPEERKVYGMTDDERADLNGPVLND